MTSKLDDMQEMADLIEKARALGPMTDAQRREQAASFAFGNLALTSQWCDKPAEELAKLREMCRKAAGCVKITLPYGLNVPTLKAVVEAVEGMEHFGEGLIHQGDLLGNMREAIRIEEAGYAKPHPELQPQRHAAVSLVEAADGRVLCVWNRRYEGWSLPGGMVEDGETPAQAQARELKEETDLVTWEAELVFEGQHAIKAKEGAARPGRASYVHVFRILSVVEGAPRMTEEGCPVTWLTREQFLSLSPFREFYERVFRRVPPVLLTLTRGCLFGDNRIAPRVLQPEPEPEPYTPLSQLISKHNAMKALLDTRGPRPLEHWKERYSWLLRSSLSVLGEERCCFDASKGCYRRWRDVPPGSTICTCSCESCTRSRALRHNDEDET